MSPEFETELAHEPVAVLARFDSGALTPLRFRRGAQVYTVRQVTRRWMHADGDHREYHFALFTTDCRFWQLAFETRFLQWTMERCR